MTLKAKTVIVVGAYGNVGRSVVESLAGAGCDVVGVGRDPVKLARLQSELEQPISVMEADFTNERDVMKCIEKCVLVHGSVDYVVYAASLAADAETRLVDCSKELWHATFDTHVSGFFLALRGALPVMNPHGHFVVLSSAITRYCGSALPPMIHAAPYAAAKAALDEMCKWARRECHERGVLLSRLAPGALDVPFHRDAPSFRRPKTMIPVTVIAGKIRDALLHEWELDESIIE